MYASFYNSTPLPYNQNHHNFFTLLVLETIRLTIFPLYHFPKQYHRPVSTMGLFSITFPSLSIIDSNEITSLNNVLAIIPHGLIYDQYPHHQFRLPRLGPRRLRYCMNTHHNIIPSYWQKRWLVCVLACSVSFAANPLRSLIAGILANCENCNKQ